MADDFFADAAASTKQAASENTEERNPTWEWKEPIELKAKLVEARIQMLRDGTAKYLLTIENQDDGGLYSLWMGGPDESPKMLTSGWNDAAPKVGKLFFIDYQGKRPTQDGRFKYGVFYVRAEEADHAFWLDLFKQKLAKLETAQLAATANAGSQAGGVSIDDLPDAF